ncbi:MAG TPA: hypothetical protein VEZ90_07435, partial [Blastocatellia bacterium]|nr:hypothetical protein [Blastocatellia bacterium]
AAYRCLSGLCLDHGVSGSYSASWARSFNARLQFCEAVQKSGSGKLAAVRSRFRRAYDGALGNNPHEALS